jgi:hypothetical protein
MAADLADNHLAMRMTRDDVIALLGKPDESYEGVYASDRTIAYEMGCWMDCNWMVVQFDDTWHLTHAFDYQD